MPSKAGRFLFGKRPVVCSEEIIDMSVGGICQRPKLDGCVRSRNCKSHKSQVECDKLFHRFAFVLMMRVERTNDSSSAEGGHEGVDGNRAGLPPFGAAHILSHP